jgi:hypothetical protein
LAPGTIGLLAVLTTSAGAGTIRVGESVFGFLVKASLEVIVGWLITLFTGVARNVHQRRTTRPFPRPRHTSPTRPSGF